MYFLRPVHVLDDLGETKWNRCTYIYRGHVEKKFVNHLRS